MNFLFNPYRKVAGSKALMIGFAIALFTLAVAPFSHAAFDGVLDLHTKIFENVWAYSLLYFISWIMIVAGFGIAAVLFSKSQYRWIDILGTTLLAKAPLLFLAIVNFLSQDIPIKDLSDVAVFFTLRNVIVIIIDTLCAIWMVALLYNAYSVSLHIKGNKLIWSFILILILAEISSKIIIYYLIPFLK
ncbi:MAG: hypothetical protein ABI204_04545 [Ginsengibacter sp.]